MTDLARRFRAAVAVASLSLTIAAAAQTIPPVVATTPGTLLSVQAQKPGASLPHAGQRYLIVYRSRGVHGEPVVTSGFVLFPKGQPPNHGWPVLAWAHGTTGVADTCAPSADHPGGPVHDYQLIANGALDWWLAHGYAITAPDYQGLGTPGGHPYMDAASQLHSVDDAVRAIHQLRPRALNPDWLVMGHSQGGAAALEVAAHGQTDAPEFKLLGAIAIAPGGYDYAGIAQYALDHPQLAPAVAAFFPIVLLGAQAAEPSLDIDQLVSAQMQPLLNLARSRCLSELRTEIQQSPATVFRKHADLTPLLGYLDRQAIEHMTPTVPVMFVQGNADQLVDAHGTHAYYEQICKAGKTVFYRAIANGSHRDALSQSPTFAPGFLAFLAGKQSLRPCASSPSVAQ